MLYPYRASAIKNQQRWNFGVLCPQLYSEQQNGSDAWMMQTQCLIEAGPLTRLNVKVRCLAGRKPDNRKTLQSAA